MARHRILIRHSVFLLGGIMLLAACGAKNSPANDEPPAKTQPPVETPMPPPSTPSSAPARPDPAAPAASTQPPPPAAPSDITARQPAAPTPCPGMNLPRPPGSNCYGIVPSACAADGVSAFVGRSDSAALRRELTAVAGHDNIRWIRPGEAVIENLDPTRLNVALDARGRVATVDCY